MNGVDRGITQVLRAVEGSVPAQLSPLVRLPDKLADYSVALFGLLNGEPLEQMKWLASRQPLQAVGAHCTATATATAADCPAPWLLSMSSFLSPALNVTATFVGVAVGAGYVIKVVGPAGQRFYLNHQQHVPSRYQTRVRAMLERFYQP